MKRINYRQNGWMLFAYLSADKTVGFRSVRWDSLAFRPFAIQSLIHQVNDSDMSGPYTMPHVSPAHNINQLKISNRIWKCSNMWNLRKIGARSVPFLILSPNSEGSPSNCSARIGTVCPISLRSRVNVSPNTMKKMNYRLGAQGKNNTL